MIWIGRENEDQSSSAEERAAYECFWRADHVRAYAPYAWTNVSQQACLEEADRLDDKGVAHLADMLGIRRRA